MELAVEPPLQLVEITHRQRLDVQRDVVVVLRRQSDRLERHGKGLVDDRFRRFERRQSAKDLRLLSTPGFLEPLKSKDGVLLAVRVVAHEYFPLRRGFEIVE